MEKDLQKIQNAIKEFCEKYDNKDYYCWYTVASLNNDDSVDCVRQILFKIEKREQW